MLNFRGCNWLVPTFVHISSVFSKAETPPRGTSGVICCTGSLSLPFFQNADFFGALENIREASRIPKKETGETHLFL